MENEARLKALNILFTASATSLVVSMCISVVPRVNNAICIISPVLTYIIGRILCYKEYKDETP